MMRLFNFNKALSLSFLFAISSIASLLLIAYASPLVVSAKKVSEMSPTEEMKSLAYYNALTFCIKNTNLSSGGINTNRISEEHANEGKWFNGVAAYGKESVNIGFFLFGAGIGEKKQDLNCEKGDWIKDAATLWGYSNGIDLLCDTGAKRVNDSNCRKGSGGFSGKPRSGVDSKLDADLFQSNIKNKMYDGKTPSVSKAANYTLTRNAFFVGCGGSMSPTVWTQADLNTNGRDDFVVSGIKNVTDTGAIQENIYYLQKKHTDKIKWWVDSDGKTSESTCLHVAQKMNEYADDYSQKIQDMIKLGQPIQDETTTGDDDEETPTTCSITGIGWLLCPVINWLASIADGAFEVLSNNFLKTDVKILETNRGVYTAWASMRNVANVLFIIAFLIIVYSQLTGAGISNYGVKKMLPRLIIAAILVNTSYFICQLAVDISNILGFSVTQFFESLAPKNPLPTVSGDQGSGWTGVAGGILSGAVAVGAILIALYTGVLLPILLAGIVALLMILFILLGRQALIILLIVAAPVAFIAFLLPNTQKWFDKWRKTFTTMLLVFPIVAVVFGASKLASSILTDVYTGDITPDGATDDQNIWGQMLAAAAGVLPLFIVPGLLKKSLDGVGAIGAKINGAGAKITGSAKGKAAKMHENSRLGQLQKYRQGEKAKRRALIQSGNYEGRGGKLNPRNLVSSANRRLNSSDLSGAFGDRALATGAAIADKEDTELLSNAGSRLESMTIGGKPLSQAQLMQMSLGKELKDDKGNIIKVDSYLRRSAIQKASRIATVSEAEELVNASGGMSVSERKTLSSSIASSSAINKAPYLGGKTLGRIEQGTANVDDAALEALSDGKITAETLAATDKSSANTILRAAQRTAFGSKERASLKGAYDKLNDPNSRLGEKITPSSDHDNVLKGMRSL